MRIRVSHLKDRKQRRERFAVLTAYDATIARLLERAGVDVLLVGDSVATAVLGYDTTLPVTLDVMIHHTAAVVRGTEKALVIADMPFLTYQITPGEQWRQRDRLDRRHTREAEIDDRLLQSVGELEVGKGRRGCSGHRAR